MVIYSFKSGQLKRPHAEDLEHQNNQYAATNARLNADMERTQLQWKHPVPKIQQNRELLEQISAEIG
jgi:hypothetical protein